MTDREYALWMMRVGALARGEDAFEYRIVLVDDPWIEEVRGPIPDRDEVEAHLKDLRARHPENTYAIQPVVPAVYGELEL
jgi:hypothetical protein